MGLRWWKKKPEPPSWLPFDPSCLPIDEEGEESTEPTGPHDWQHRNGIRADYWRCRACYEFVFHPEKPHMNGCGATAPLTDAEIDAFAGSMLKLLDSTDDVV